MATRVASGKVLDRARPPCCPSCGAARPTSRDSNNTTMEGADSFLPEPATRCQGANPYGRTLHFGIREHAMGAVMNGIALHGGTRVYGGTFLVFSDYMRAAVRLAALMKLPVTYVWTHDSIGLGEDGPTHQPVEHLAALRAIPGLDVVRPADANETAVAWRTVLEHTDRPAGLALTRQNVPTFDRTVFASAEGTARGGYVLADAGSGTPQVVLIATGSEVQIARRRPRARSRPRASRTRVVSMPVRRVVPRAGRRLPALGAARRRARPGVRRGRRRRRAGTSGSGRTASACPSSTSGQVPRTTCSTSSSASPRSASWRPPARR